MRWIWLGIAALLVACAPTAELGKRHQPSRLATPLPTPDFEGYILAARQYVAAANQVAGNPLAPSVVEDRGPYELPPQGSCARRKDEVHAALLIHDLGETPYMLRDLGERLARACYLVRAILLPGHGGVPGDLLDVDYRDWQEAVRLGVASLAGDASDVTLIGFGTGGTLALDYLQSDQPSAVPVAALVLLAPAMAEPAPRFEVQAQRLLYALAPSGGWLGTQGAWPQVFADKDPVRYESLPSNARRQADRVVLGLAGQEGSLDLPVFLAIGEDDVSVDPQAARQWFCSSLAGPRRMLWYTTAPGAASCRFVTERSIPATRGVLDLSHIGLPIAPSNPRYGRDSGYRSCLHYYWEKDAPSWFFCSDPAKTAANSDVRYGEISQANLHAHVMRRLTYNPDFDGLVADLVNFLADARSSSGQAPPPGTSAGRQGDVIRDAT
ncbi:MAG TPA: alpha/beta fold hydrolase [Geminicoccaceae bacterium]|nr:alpha/beta fold hydrolase [Geminicoccaceae bacterium]